MNRRNSIEYYGADDIDCGIKWFIVGLMKAIMSWQNAKDTLASAGTKEVTLLNE